MSDLIDEPEEGANAPEFTVTEISGAIKRVIEGEFGHVRIRGEIGRVSRPRSGHIYLDLKDDRSVLSGVIWKGVAARLATRPEEGLEVVAVGRITTFGGQSKYQIVIEDIRPAGVGALMAMLEKRKKALQAEGLFDPARKRPLPYLPDVIGVVTSPSGAVIRDILHRLRDRFPRKVLIWPVAVQGEICAPEVARAIEGFNRLTPGGPLPRPDLIIVARGGGSIEDLWGFNEEAVVRAAAASQIPLISAVGHETDTTLIDLAADRRAPTPTAAAELAVPVRMELLSWTDDQGARLTRALGYAITQRNQRLRDMSRALPRPRTLTEWAAQKLDTVGARLPQALIRGVDQRRLRLSHVTGSLRPSALRRTVQGKREQLQARAPRLAPALKRSAERRREMLNARAERLSPQPILQEIAREKRRVTDLSARLEKAGKAQITTRGERLTAWGRMLDTLSYQATLQRGYAVVWGDGAVVTTRAAAGAAQALEIEFADGRFTPGQSQPGPRKSTPKKTPPEQGNLF
ncbi:Exodeoxyribonuclease VII large subunit [Salinihabitans flavidus]|uniref:Exodeoxyribonuclease 7 large subunit n=1 Tax=Salinihabitans flavidus TaxID=569882 RepID=A0A1H8MSK0_9RHOB|nr:exodeoxyribonuclease VII large subunit [Salinihabitans flavidus]SEO20317.1 Exodeoxyribonuclease VII large subunit [Salinihabitans flavidus]